jgi:hypothetical protein
MRPAKPSEPKWSKMFLFMNIAACQGKRTQTEYLHCY